MYTRRTLSQVYTYNSDIHRFCGYIHHTLMEGGNDSSSSSSNTEFDYAVLLANAMAFSPIVAIYDAITLTPLRAFKKVIPKNQVPIIKVPYCPKIGF